MGIMNKWKLKTTVLHFLMAAVLLCSSVPAMAEEAAPVENASGQTETPAEDASGQTEAPAEDASAQPGTPAEQTSEDSTVDFVIVLDCSGSLKVEEQALCISASKMFIDMLPSENARLAILGFGKDFGDEAYPMNVVEGESATNRRVKVYYELSNIVDQNSKETAKEAVEAVANDIDGDASTVGYALQAAGEILVANGAASDSAAILLMSDGQVKGQDESDRYNEGYDYHSIDTAVTTAQEHGWPVYCMELNEDGKNDSNEWEANVARYQMRENIPQKTGTGPIMLQDASAAENKFAEIFGTFFGASPTTAEMTIDNGMASMAFDIDELVAETNITLTSETDQIGEVERVELVGPDGATEVYSASDSASPNRIVVFEDRYITMKLLTPTNGRWTLNVYGTDGVKIGLYAVSIREMNLRLKDNEPYAEGGILPRGTDVEFSAFYLYHSEEPYTSPTVYREIPALLTIEKDGQTETLEMSGEDSRYAGTYHFADSGVYTVKVGVQSDLFRTGDKESEVLTYTVGNLPVVAEGTIPAQETGVRSSLTLDCTPYFRNPDNDPLTYGVAVDETNDPTNGIQAVMDAATGMLTISSGRNAGTVNVTVTATDGMSDAAVQPFAVTTVNQPLVFTELAQAEPDAVQIEKTVNLVLKKNSAPGFLMKAADISGEPEFEMNFADYFTDPDNPDGSEIGMECAPDSANDASIVIEESDLTHVRIIAEDKGSGSFLITATDANDPSVQRTIALKINSVNAWAVIAGKFWLPAVIVLVILIALIVFLVMTFGGRKIYGVWDIKTSRGVSATSINFAKTNVGKSAKAKLSALLKAANVIEDMGQVEVAVGNNLNQKVFIQNLKTLNSVTIGAKAYNHQQLQKTKKLEIGRGRTAVLEKADGTRVTLIRHRN